MLSEVTTSTSESIMRSIQYTSDHIVQRGDCRHEFFRSSHNDGDVDACHRSRAAAH
jgi:hypothetical protein